MLAKQISAILSIFFCTQLTLGKCAERLLHTAALSLLQLQSELWTAKERQFPHLQPEERSNTSGHDVWPLPVLKPVQHSFYSTNANASAQFILRYFKHTKLLKDQLDGVFAVEYCPRKDADCMIMSFVEKTMPTGAIAAQDFVRASDSDWERVARNAISSHTKDYSPWVDFHDGINGEYFDVDLAIADGIPIQKYQMPRAPVRLNLPYTMYTLELINGVSDENAEKLYNYAGVEQPDSCRRGLGGAENERAGDNYWWKSTYGVPDPVAAANFAVHALGARRIQAPFDTSAPHDRPCITAGWVVLPDRATKFTEEEANVEADLDIDNVTTGIMLHFIQNPAWKTTQGLLTVDDLAHHLNKLRTANSNTFDEYMYNYVEFRTETLDPFLARFAYQSIPHLVRQTEQGLYVVYVSEPANGVVFKITSSKMTSRGLILTRDPR